MGLLLRMTLVSAYSHEYEVHLISKSGMKQLEVGHKVAQNPADAIAQWYNAGGMVQYYDYPLEVLLNVRQVSHTYFKYLVDSIGNSRPCRQRHSLRRSPSKQGEAYLRS